MTAAAPDAPAVPEGWKALRLGGMWDSLGPVLAQRGEAGWRYALATGPVHANPLGVIHGGVVMALLDHTMTLVAFDAAGRVPCVTVQMDTRFFASARPGELLVSTPVLRHSTNSMLFMTADLCADGRVVAEGTATLKRLRA
ncbi:PaaI family thioesterase [Salipiger sp.]|uniref:PaaI family thioesterase n=1 Tax=Salipiger sp. TaxID=2078585 RepID=UPI003A97A808